MKYIAVESLSIKAKDNQKTKQVKKYSPGDEVEINQKTGDKLKTRGLLKIAGTSKSDSE